MSTSLIDLISRELVWNKGKIIKGFDSKTWRSDDYGMPIRKSDYGNRNSQYGWEIDHIIPNAVVSLDHISNLRPLHWRVNSSRQAGRF